MNAELSDPEIERTIVSWIEENVGTVQSIARDGRWRPAWCADVQCGEERISLYVRCDRGGRFPPMPLSYEARVHQIFADCGVKVPKLYGYIEEIPAIVMERVRGRPNMATAKDDATRDRLREQLADQMLLIHQIDPSLLLAAGAPEPKDPKDVTLAHYRQAESLYLTGADKLPSPDIEFVRRWLDRNAPPAEEDACVIAMDAGQFIFEGDELTAMLDFEFVTIGDRNVDFAALRTRDTFEQIGNLEEFFQLYEARGGRPVHRKRTEFQHIPFVMYAPMEVAEELARTHRTVDDSFEYYCWHANGLQTAIEDIARYTGVKLPEYVPPDREKSRRGFSLQGLVTDIDKVPAADEYAIYRKNKVAAAANCFAIREGWAASFEREYLADVQNLTGKTAATEWEADVVLERFVQMAGPELDEPLLQLLYRRARRLMLPIENTDPALVYG